MLRGCYAYLLPFGTAIHDCLELYCPICDLVGTLLTVQIQLKRPRVTAGYLQTTSLHSTVDIGNGTTFGFYNPNAEN
jgi:hypothetical protein